MPPRGQPAELPGPEKSLRPIAVGVFAGILCCIALLLVFSAVLATQNIPQSAIGPMAVFAVSAGGFAAGYLCARMMRANGLMYGAVCGLIITALVLLAGQFSGSGGLGVPALFRGIFITLSAMAGGVVRVNTRRRRR